MSEETNKSETVPKSLPPLSVTQVIPGGQLGLGLTSGFTPVEFDRLLDQTQTATSTTTVISLEAYTGFLPPAHELAKYSPEERAWILDEAKLNAEHIRSIEKQSLKIRANDENLHRIIPALIVVCFLIASTIIAVFASAAWGSAGIGAVIIAVAVAYFKGQHRSTSHRNQKAPSEPSEQNTEGRE